MLIAVTLDGKKPILTHTNNHFKTYFIQCTLWEIVLSISWYMVSPFWQNYLDIQVSNSRNNSICMQSVLTQYFPETLFSDFPGHATLGKHISVPRAVYLNDVRCRYAWESLALQTHCHKLAVSYFFYGCSEKKKVIYCCAEQCSFSF